MPKKPLTKRDCQRIYSEHKESITEIIAKTRKDVRENGFFVCRTPAHAELGKCEGDVGSIDPDDCGTCVPGLEGLVHTHPNFKIRELVDPDLLEIENFDVPSRGDVRVTRRLGGEWVCAINVKREGSEMNCSGTDDKAARLADNMAEKVSTFTFDRTTENAEAVKIATVAAWRYGCSLDLKD